VADGTGVGDALVVGAADGCGVALPIGDGAVTGGVVPLEPPPPPHAARTSTAVIAAGRTMVTGERRAGPELEACSNMRTYDVALDDPSAWDFRSQPLGYLPGRRTRRGSPDRRAEALDERIGTQRSLDAQAR
jgi:hypothetical protein